MSTSAFPLPLSAIPNTASANTVFSGPTTGSPTTPNFRALVGADVGLTTKGDLLTYSTALATLGVGASGTLLGADSAQTTGLKWVSPPTALGCLGAKLDTTRIQILANSDSYNVPYTEGTPHTGITGANASDIITDNANGYSNGDYGVFTSITGGAGLVINQPYYIIGVATNTYQLSLRSGGTAVNFTTDITAGTFIKITPLSLTIPSSAPYSLWSIGFYGLVAYGTSINSGMAMALVTDANSMQAPGNSTLIWPPNYVSNTGSNGLYSGLVVEASSGAAQQFYIPFIISTTPNTQVIIKPVYAARVALGTSTWVTRGIFAIPIS